MVTKVLRGRYTHPFLTASTTSRTHKTTFPEWIIARKSTSCRKEVAQPRWGLSEGNAVLQGCLQEFLGFRLPTCMFPLPLSQLTREMSPHLWYRTSLQDFSILFYLEVLYKRHSLARGQSEEFSSSPEKSVTGLGLFTSNPKELISSFHINKPYAEPR